MRSCPICRRPASDEAPARPFCSERCRLVDLGKWLEGSYRVTAPIAEEDLDAGLPTEGEDEPPQ